MDTVFKSVKNKVRVSLTIVLLFATSVLAVVAQTHSAFAASSVAIDGSTIHQTINGFGAAEAFGEATSMMNVGSATAQQQMLNLLYSPTTGAGLTIQRNIIPSDSTHTIEPNAPASPSATPSYASIGNDWGQIWLAQQAQSFGVNQFYNDAWGAPAFMKTNNSDVNGGTLCGVPGASCSSGDWRQAYANYLVQYLKDYSAAGIPVSYVGYVNEPSFAPTYSGMVLNPTQLADFATVLGPTLASSGLSTRIICCDSEGWNLASGDVGAFTANAAANSNISIFSSHGYTAPPNSLINTTNKPIWETEWSTFDNFDAAWDDGSDASGFTWAQHIYTGLTSANLSAFLYWWGVSTSTDNEQLILLNGTTVTTTGRLWAMANYSRYIRPNAVRIGSTTADGNLTVTAYKNTNGTIAIVVLNSATSAIATNFSLANTGIANGATVTPVLTNGSNNAATQTTTSVSAGAFSATIPARSLETFVIPAAAGSPTPTPTATSPVNPTPTATSPVNPTPTPTTVTGGSGCKITYAVTTQWSTGFTANITITNTGSTAINGWTLGFSFPNGQTVTQGWNGTFSQSGSNVTIASLSYNAAIPAGGSVSSSPGFNGAWAGSNGSPGSFTLNGVVCS